MPRAVRATLDAMWRIVVLVALVGCTEHHVSTWPRTLAAASNDLRARGEATIEVAEGDEDDHDKKRRTATVHASDTVEVEIDLGQGASRSLELRIDKLLAGCPTDEHCMLARARGPIVLERSRRGNGTLALTIGGGLVFTGALVCAFECEPPWSTASRVTLGAVAVVGLVGLGIVYIASKAGD